MKKGQGCVGEWSCFCLQCRVWMADILWPLAKKGVDLTTLVFYFHLNNLEWAGMALGALFLPGCLEVLYWSVRKAYDCRKSCCYMSFLFNPIFFPFTLIAWHVSLVSYGVDTYEGKYSVSRVLCSLQVLTESVSLIIIHSFVLMQTWRCNMMNLLQGLCIAMSILSLAKELSEHHFHELSAKSDIPSNGQILVGSLFYLLQIILRLPTICLLLLCLRHWVLIFLLIYFLINFLAAFKLKSDVSKNIWTSLSSLLAPVCFVNKAQIVQFKHAGDTFHKFYLWNSLLYFVLAIFGHISVNFIMVYGNDALSSWILNNIRTVNFLSEGCFESGTSCPNLHIASTVAVLVTLLQPVAIWAQPFLFSVMIGQHFPKTSNIIDV